MAHSQHTYAVILAGGGGTRLWPKSRQATPKQFLKLLGTKTMLQLTVQRIERLVPYERMIVITNQAYLAEIRAQLPSLPKENILLEPKKCDTALAMLTGALYAHALDSEAVILNAAADHIVSNEAAFESVMHTAISVAAKPDYLVSIGITPTYPSTAFGYIQIGSEIENLPGKHKVFAVKNFTEKPDAATARAFIATGRYFWNANMYVWSSENVIKAFAQYAPEILAFTQPLRSATPAAFNDLLPTVYQHAEAISIDYAISEKADNLVLIPADLGWNDIGEWKVVHELGEKDANGNVLVSDHTSQTTPPLLLDSGGNLVHSNGKLIALLGVNDMIVVDTEDIVFIAPMTQSQAVKKVVETLKKSGQDSYL